MKSLKFIFPFLFFLPIILFGQEKDSIISEKLLNLEEVIPVPNKGFILFKTDSLDAPSVLDFSYFNLDNELVSTVSIPTSRTNELFAIEKIFIWHEKLIICSSLYQLGLKKNHLLYYEYSLPNLTLTKSEILLKTTAPQSVYVPYFINLSPDSSKLIALGWNYSLPREKAALKGKVFNEDLEIEKQFNYKFDFENQRIAIEDVFLDDKNNIYVTGNNYRGRLESQVTPYKLDHFVLGVFHNEVSNLWIVKEEKRFFSQIKYQLNKEQKLIGLGLWNKNLKPGYGLIKISQDSQKACVTTHPIDFKTFIESYSKNLQTYKAPKTSFSGYDINHVIYKVDGYYLVGERNIYEGLFEDILVIKVALDGSLMWISRVPKVQQTFGVSEKLVSYKMLERKDKLFFLFNDNYLNYKNGNSAYLKATTPVDAKPALAELSLSDGSIERKMLRSLLKKDYLFMPAFCQKTTEAEVIIVGSGILTKAGKFLLKKVKIKK